MKRHKWERNNSSPLRHKDKWCHVCGLTLSVRAKRYRTPRYGYKTGFEYTWYQNARIVGNTKAIPLECTPQTYNVIPVKGTVFDPILDK